MIVDAPALERTSAADRWLLGFLAAGLILTTARIVGLALTPLDLHGDEAQYWLWSRQFAWGYFSKPPLIAWTIGAVTAVFGNAEWAVRLFAPIAHALGALALFALGRRLYGPEAGFWAGMGWLVMPGVWLSASLASTDALLLPIWSFALLAFFALKETRAWGWAAALGLAVGLGFLAKYAMSYFLIGAALASIISPEARRVLLSAKGALALVIAGAVIAPNIAWNAANDFATVAHTAENSNLGGGVRFSFAEVGQFIADQMAVFGPFAWIALAVAGIAAVRAGGLGERERMLIAFVAPPLLIILVQAFLSRAHANWAAAAYPAAMVLFVGLALARPHDRPRSKRALAVALVALILGAAAAAADVDAIALTFALVLAWAFVSMASSTGRRAPIVAVIMHAALGAVFLTAALSPPVANAIGLADAFKRSRNWQETADIVAARAAEGGQAGAFTAVMVDDRLLFNDLTYYWREGAPAPLRMWVLGATAGNHAEEVAAMAADVGANVLIVGATPAYQARIAEDFSEIADPEPIEIDLGGGEFRRLYFREARGFVPEPR